MGYVTFGLAVLGAGLGIFNTITGYMRGADRWRIEPLVKPGKDGRLTLFVEVVNPGRFAVSIKEVVLAGPGKQAQCSETLTDECGHPRFPLKIPPGESRTIGPVYAYTIEAVSVFKPITVVAKAQDGRVIKRRCVRLRQIYAQLDAAKAERAAQGGR